MPDEQDTAATTGRATRTPRTRAAATDTPGATAMDAPVAKTTTRRTTTAKADDGTTTTPKTPATRRTTTASKATTGAAKTTTPRRTTGTTTATRSTTATRTTASRATGTRATGATGAKTTRTGGTRAPAPPVEKGTRLVIVESPAKAKTITKYLGPGYSVRASFGHVRDLPEKGIGVDLKNDFAPTYVVPEDKEDTIKGLRAAVRAASAVYLATDPDREGEAIAWHVLEATEPGKTKEVHRVTFNEITKSAVQYAIAHPRKIDMDLVEAQQARRVLDRLVGYRLSPFLIKKVTRGLSAGRVQSVALRLVVEREREITAFVPVESWSVEADFAKITGQARAARDRFHARLTHLNGKKADLKIHDDAQAVLDGLHEARYAVEKVTKSERKRGPAPPFITSTLQQEASRRHGYAVGITMRIAQGLYEGVKVGKEGEVGLITYMRTDSVNISDEARELARQVIVSRYGADYYPPKPNFYKTKAKGAQEAHEAIRPTDPARTPDELRPFLTDQQYNVYRLVWQRFVASQMAQAIFDMTAVDLIGTPPAGANRYTFRANGSVPRFLGFLAVYRAGRDEGDAEEETERDALPSLEQGENVALEKLLAEQHFTQPPPRYTEASLVKALEEQGIGRPSTYAPTIATILARNYVEKQERALVPTELGSVVTDVLVANFPDILSYGFTSQMEETLDDVAEGKRQWVPVLRDFYTPFAARVKEAEATSESVGGQMTDIACQVCGKPMLRRLSRSGPFLSCSDYPECKGTMNLDAAGNAVPKAQDEPTDEICPTCGKPMVVKTGRFGRFIACVDYPTCKTTKRIEVTTGVHCPQCGTGELVMRKTRIGKRTFWGCNRYPDCDYTTNADPAKTPPVLKPARERELVPAD